MPFDRDAFLAVFEAYHAAVGPAPLVLYVVGVVAVALAVSERTLAHRIALAILAALWLWMGAVYHLRFFAAINPAAWIFGGVFCLQAGLFVIALGRSRERPAAKRSSRVVGLVLVAYALVVYPLLAALSDHAFPRSPTFGLPCPTTIFTLGILLVLPRRPPAWLTLIPVLWGVVGTSAAFTLGIHEDLGLGAAALAGFVGLVVEPLRRRSFAALHRELVAARLGSVHTAPILREHDLAALPEPVRAWVRTSGAVGLPRPTHFAAKWRGRIRSGPDAPWMPFVAEQHNFVQDPARFFLMKARRAGLPIDVFHAFYDGAASMRVRLIGMVPINDAHGDDLTRAETVTLLNDLCVLAPGALAAPAIRWESIDDRSARAHYMLGTNTVSAVLVIDDEGRLVDFVSDDRLVASSDGKRFTPQRWSTPLRAHRRFGAHTAPSWGEGRWHPQRGAFTYVELELLDLEVA